MLYEQRARENSDRATASQAISQHESEALLQEQLKVLACTNESQSEAIVCSKAKEMNATLYQELQQSQATQSLLDAKVSHHIHVCHSWVLE